MVEDAQTIGDEVLTKIAAAVEHIDGASRGKTPQQRDALRGKLPALIKSEMQAAEKKLKAAPAARWKKFVARAQQYKDYKIEAGVNLTIGVLGTAGAAAGIVGSGGAGLALGIVALVRSVADTVKQIYNLSIEAEKVERDLEKDLNTLKNRYENAVGTAKQGASEVGVSVLKGILGTDPPFIAALPKCSDNMTLWDNKVAGITTIGRKLSGDITKAMAAVDKLETQIKGSDDVKVRKIVDNMKKARKSLDQSLTKCENQMARVRSAEKAMPVLKKMLKALEATNPKYADIFDKVFPKAVNLALSGASAGVGFKDAKTALDTANVALGLVNDVANEGRGALEEMLG